MRQYGKERDVKEYDTLRQIRCLPPLRGADTSSRARQASKWETVEQLEGCEIVGSQVVSPLDDCDGFGCAYCNDDNLWLAQIQPCHIEGCACLADFFDDVELASPPYSPPESASLADVGFVRANRWAGKQ